jgi:hypothetical protein
MMDNQISLCREILQSLRFYLRKERAREREDGVCAREKIINILLKHFENRRPLLLFHANVKVVWNFSSVKTTGFSA